MTMMKALVSLVTYDDHADDANDREDNVGQLAGETGMIRKYKTKIINKDISRL